MSLKSRVENHFLLILLSACASTGGAVYAVAHFFHSRAINIAEQSHELEQDELESRLASIERGVKGQKRLDIRKLIRTSDDSSIIGKYQTYFPGEQFYAQKNISGFDHQEISELQYHRLLAGFNARNAFVSSDGLGGVPINLHLWRNSKDFKVQTKNHTSHWFPHFCFQKMSRNQVNQLSRLGANEAVSELESKHKIRLDAESVGRQLEQLANVMADDIVGMFFYHQLSVCFDEAIADPQISTRLVKNQKLGNVLYAQFRTQYNDVKVNQRVRKAFYVHHEVILLSTADDIYLVKIVIPSYEPAPRNEMHARVNLWLSSLQIAVD